MQTIIGKLNVTLENKSNVHGYFIYFQKKQYQNKK